jgi:hypothetical protein
MIMNEKLKKISSKLSNRYKDSKSLTSIYHKFLSDVQNNQEYFSRYDTRDYVKMVIYIYSLMETGGFEWGDGMIKNSWVGNYFEFGEGDYAEDECDNCNGNGSIDCDVCDGNGELECSTCSGSGQVTCPACDGDAEDEEGDECSECRGNGEVDCDDCDGGGRETCNNCGGDSSETCSECNGNGVVESDELNYYNTTFITWDKYLINRLRNSMELNNPTGINDFTRYIEEEKMFTLSIEQDRGEFKTEVSPDKVYCFTLNPLSETDLFIRKNPEGLTTMDKPHDYMY